MEGTEGTAPSPCPKASSRISLRSGRFGGGAGMTHTTPFHFHVVWCLLWLEFWSQTDGVQVLLQPLIRCDFGQTPKPCVASVSKTVRWSMCCDQLHWLIRRPNELAKRWTRWTPLGLHPWHLHMLPRSAKMGCWPNPAKGGTDP